MDMDQSLHGTIGVIFQIPPGLDENQIDEYKQMFLVFQEEFDALNQRLQGEKLAKATGIEYGGEIGPELLSCPFCGSSARLNETVVDCWYVQCEKVSCGACTALYQASTEAIQSWNRRATSGNRVDPDGPKCYWFDDEGTYRHWKCEMDTVEYVMYRLDEMLPDEHHPPTLDQIRQLLQVLKS